MTPSLSRPLFLFFALALAVASSGCGLFSKNHLRGPEFTLHSDRSPEFLARVAEKTARIYRGFEELFELSPDRLGRTAIVLEGEETDIIDQRYAPDILGYYIPLLNYISIDTAPCSQDDAMLEQVLLHEVAHHFIVTEWPPASGECWLNEGLAGALEVTVFEGARFEHPLVNPVLYQLAREEAFARNGKVSLGDLIEMSWSRFHRREDKERNYALAWSAVYFLLERHLPRGQPLGKRIEALYGMNRDAIARLEPEWIAFVRGFDVTGHLVAMSRNVASEYSLSAIWATKQLGTLRVMDDLRILEGLVSLFDDPDPLKRVHAYISFLRKLEGTSHSFFLDQESVRHGVDRIGTVLEDPSEPPPLREAVAVALGASFRTSDRWIQPLVTLLDGGHGELRAAAAQSLSRIAKKPTIVNPAFWREAPAGERAREVAEWRTWLAIQGREGPAAR